MKQFRIYFSVSILSLAAGAAWAQNFSSIPSRIVGQSVLQQIGNLTASAPNLVEGRELNQPQAVAVDTSANPPILYVADTNNNRVLAWKNANAFSKGTFADKVVGQRDFLTTTAQGPAVSTNALSTGLFLPIAVAVDKNGALYVADVGNNRILRYPAPFQQTSQLLAVDLVIGQPDVAHAQANQGQQNPSANTLLLASGNAFFRVGLAFDSQGNLWVSDAGNNRVLRFPASELASGAANNPNADLVIGQTDFVSRGLPAQPARTLKTFLAEPAGLAFDPSGRLFVSDQANRVLVYAPPLSTGMSAARIMGVIQATQQVPNPPTLNESTLGNPNGQIPPNGIFFVGANPFVVDTGNARILEYEPYDQWPAESAAFSPAAIAVIGQNDFVSNKSNLGLAQPSAMSLSGFQNAHNVFEATGPIGAAYDGSANLYVADTGNNRVLAFPLQTGTQPFTAASRLLGQNDFQYNSVNLIEGREFFFYSAALGTGGGGVAIDSKSNPPHLYVADPLNNRILCYRDYRKVGLKLGSPADLVIGQPDMFTAEINYPSNSQTQSTAASLNVPEGVAVDASGNLWVSDSGNGRVLRFPSPFNQATTSLQPANLVLGQPNFSSHITDASSQTMGSPYGIAFTALGHVVVSDASAKFNRVLLFLKPSGGDFTIGQNAANVIGQPDFGPPSENLFSVPRGIAVDGDDRLYVADTGNSQIKIFPNLPTAGNDPQPTTRITSDGQGQGLSGPQGVFINPSTAEIWISDTNDSRVIRLPNYTTLLVNPAATASLTVFLPFGLALDPFGNPIAVEGLLNRVSFYYPLIDNTGAAGGVNGRFSGNGANYFGRFAPSMLASIFAFPGQRFGDQTIAFNQLPNPLPITTSLGDVQVTVNGVPAPLLYVSPGQINLQIPAATPTGSTLREIQVVRVSTGQVLASGFFRFDTASPGLFTFDSSGAGQLAALNQDNSVNSAAHPAKAGSIIQLFATGQGVVPGLPADGNVAQGQILTNDPLMQVIINTGPTKITYSGLAPGFVGLWQINAQVPANAPPGAVPVVIVYKNVSSNLDTFGNRRLTTIQTTP